MSLTFTKTQKKYLKEALIIPNINFSLSAFTGGSLYLSSFITAESTFGRGIKQLAETVRTTCGFA